MNLPRSLSNPRIDAQERIEAWRKRFEDNLGDLLPPDNSGAEELHTAMRYAALDGGKRFRPVLVYATGAALGIEDRALDRLAAAIEIIHAYSLIHDDLPAMDDDDMRRGRPSVHRAFNEATAILAGDALQALAFQILAEDPVLDAPVCLRIVTALAEACGSMGMAGGQMLDLQAVGKRLAPEELESMHRLKTGALIKLCLVAPAMIANADPATRTALARFGASVGLAFQVHDDILDVVGESETLGKTALADIERNKATFPAIMGLDASRLRARELRDEAMAALADCHGDTSVLAFLADYVISRDR